MLACWKQKSLIEIDQEAVHWTVYENIFDWIFNCGARKNPAENKNKSKTKFDFMKL